MTGKRQLFIHSEDADLVAFGALGGRIARQDKCGLAKIGLACQFLHFVVTEAASVGENGQLVSFQRPRSKHVKLNK